MTPQRSGAPGRDIVVIGASAGRIEALQRLVEDLPPTCRRRCSSCSTSRPLAPAICPASSPGPGPCRWPTPRTVTPCGRDASPSPP
jgi:hypothetical protein